MPCPLFGSAGPTGPVEWMLVGLGNPGPKYAQSRHNVGFHIIDRLAQSEELRFSQRQSKALIARGRIEGVSVALVKPQTFMNLSGQAVGPLARFYKIPADHLLVIYDDLDLNLAQFRMRMQGSAGGHKGMTSIINHLGKQDFPRIRIGIGRPPGQMPVEAYVLQKFSDEEWEAMGVTYRHAMDAIRALLAQGLAYAMNNFN